MLAESELFRIGQLFTSQNEAKQRWGNPLFLWRHFGYMLTDLVNHH